MFNDSPIGIFVVAETVSPGVGGSGGLPTQAQAPFTVLAGPTVAPDPAPPTFRYLIPQDINFAAILGQDNAFSGTNTFAGLKVAVKTITDDYSILGNDCFIYVDATAGPITLTLPA